MHSVEVEQFAAVLNGYAPVPAHVFADVVPLLSPRDFRPGSFLLEAGANAEWAYFVVRGLVRELYISEDGSEHTRTFIAEGQTTGSLLDLLSGQPSITWIEALEATHTLAFRYASFQRLCERHPELARLSANFAAALAVRKSKRERDMLVLSARERYLQWRDEQPQLNTRIRARHLASYLGITAEHLSRLKRAAR